MYQEFEWALVLEWTLFFPESAGWPRLGYFGSLKETQWDVAPAPQFLIQ